MARHGENIYRRKDGRYEGRYVIGRKGGRTRFGYVYGRSYGDVRRELSQRKSLLGRQEEGSPKAGLTLHTWMQMYLWGSRSAALKHSTRQTYLTMYERHIMPSLGRMDLNFIHSADIQQMIALLNRKKLAQTTIAGVVRLLSSALHTAQEEGLIQQQPCTRVKLGTPPREEQRVLTPQEQERVKSAAEQACHLPTLLALYTGLRLGEVCALQWQDVDQERRTVAVRRTVQRLRATDGSGQTALMVGTPKSHKSRRTIPLPDFLFQMLQKPADAAPESYIFGSDSRPADPRTLQRQFERLIRPLELTGVHFHTLRHTFATRMLELGVDVKTVSVLLGHSSTRITLDCYAHSLLDQQRQAMAKLAAAYYEPS